MTYKLTTRKVIPQADQEYDEIKITGIGITIPVNERSSHLNEPSEARKVRVSISYAIGNEVTHPNGVVMFDPLNEFFYETSGDEAKRIIRLIDLSTGNESLEKVIINELESQGRIQDGVVDEPTR